MKGIFTTVIENRAVYFDFDRYSHCIGKSLEDIELKIKERFELENKIESNPTYKLFKEGLKIQYDFNKGISQDSKMYGDKMNELSGWMEDHKGEYKILK